MQTWEYKVVGDGLSQYELNKLGAEGWELVAFTSNNSPDSPEPGDRYVAWFKRPIGGNESVTPILHVPETES